MRRKWIQLPQSNWNTTPLYFGQARSFGKALSLTRLYARPSHDLQSKDPGPCRSWSIRAKHKMWQLSGIRWDSCDFHYGKFDHKEDNWGDLRNHRKLEGLFGALLPHSNHLFSENSIKIIFLVSIYFFRVILFPLSLSILNFPFFPYSHTSIFNSRTNWGLCGLLELTRNISAAAIAVG